MSDERGDREDRSERDASDESEARGEGDLRLKRLIARGCPRCGSKDIVPILYGYPSDLGFERAQANKVHLGGCIVEDNSPPYHCNGCHRAIPS